MRTPHPYTRAHNIHTLHSPLPSLLPMLPSLTAETFINSLGLFQAIIYRNVYVYEGEKTKQWRKKKQWRWNFLKKPIKNKTKKYIALFA